ncbi:MAG: glycerol acyltransferase [Bacteroidetes bacterium RIFOXYA12_FULL_35_11]|nr:MAG: glycerol acyltransferase [Bacteroidetes bacterium GWF2_35_48]OFY72459.1 MAG: glycerol acyltransferase [Bacteroidetes bacterium RIFOXYA12_FULL_35_11]OFY94178.1 MAG: glycerol acyltransferase [Bacteroidetes bacterium RIFOXYC12_FULL_35_7]HBX50492.1 glycerol acyltransferase [Bacteroidales bacterium]
MKENNHQPPLQIDIEQIIAAKNPRLARLLPRFILHYIKRVIHENEVNYVLRTYADKTGLVFVEAVLSYFNITIKTSGEENIPTDGKYIFAANHPLGGIEGMALLQVVSHHNREVRFVVNDILTNLKNYEPLFIPVNKHGKYSKEYAQIIEDTFHTSAWILYFPAGLVSRKVKGKIMDLEWKKSFISKSVQHKRDIIPVYIEGKNSNFFYNLSRLRTFLGIKANIEMFYLPDEMFRQKNKTITLHFGKPVSHTLFDNSKTPLEWAAYMKERVYSMGR